MDNNKFYIINYNDSELKGGAFLSYISNLELPHEIDYTDMSLEEKFSVIEYYLNSKIILETQSLSLTVAQILLQMKGVDISTFASSCIFSTAEIDQFVDKNKNALTNWMITIESSNVYLLSIFDGLEDHLKLKEQHQVVDDISFVGLNFVNLFKIPNFMEYFMSTPAIAPMYYLERQFNDYMYKGANLYPYYATADNMIYVLFHSMMSGDIDPDVSKMIPKDTGANVAE